MQKWEYLWIYVNDSGGSPVYIANGERLPAQTYAEALNIVGKGWVGIGGRCAASRCPHCYSGGCAVLSEAAFG